MQFAFFLVGGLWLVASNRAADLLSQTIVNRIDLPEIHLLLEQLLLLIFLVGGFSLLNWVSTRSGNPRVVNSLPRRRTARQEWLRGAALGWAMLLIAVLPMMLAGGLHPQPWMQPRAWMVALLSLLTLAVGTLALEVSFRGYLYSRLIAAIHPVPATAVLALIYAIVFSSYETTVWSMLSAFLMGILLSVAYLRTHALWLGWGLHFAWLGSMGLFFGLPVPGYPAISSIVATDVSGRFWLTGGPYGPEAAVFTLVVVLLAIPVLYRITRDYAWEYTHEPIVAAGYAVVIAPPAAHTAMEGVAAPAPLVQILGATPTSASTLPSIEEHLRNTSGDRN